MKPFLVAIFMMVGLLAVRAQSSADDRYIGIYGLIQQADNLAASGESSEALAAYTDAGRQLEQFQKIYPNWEPGIISFRLKQISGKISELKGQAPVPGNSISTSMANADKQENKTSTVSTPQPNGELTAQLNQLQARLQAELAANEKLQAKLKEALAVQPAAVDPRELNAAQEKIRSLMKENDLLRASRGAGQLKPETIYMTNLVKVFVTNNPVIVTNLAAAFETAPATTIVTNYVRVVDTNAMEMLRLSREAAVKNFNDEHDRAERLANELQSLRRVAADTTNSSSGMGAVVATSADATALAALQSENASLRRELDVLRRAQTTATDSGQLAVELKQARAQIAELQSEARIAALEKQTLERKLKEVSAVPGSSAALIAYETKIRELTQERDNLLKQISQPSQQMTGAGDAALNKQVESLNSEVATLRSRLATLEAQPSPYTADELALFAVGTSTPPAVSAKKSTEEMPPGTAQLVASARQHFARQEFDRAEADYQKILDHDQNNGIALANLATIEVQEGKLDQAEKHITAALSQNPNDPYNLATLGLVRLKQEKYDVAFNALSRAAQLDPNNPEIQNHLGVTLGHLGQRKAAEAALRRAIELNAGYAPAHNNLAVIYLNQDPPLATLARWHYQKAIEAGMPHNADLEKALAEKGAPVQ